MIIISSKMSVDTKGVIFVVFMVPLFFLIKLGRAHGGIFVELITVREDFISVNRGE
jgi:hypothetical protein